MQPSGVVEGLVLINLEKPSGSDQCQEAWLGTFLLSM